MSLPLDEGQAPVLDRARSGNGHVRERAVRELALRPRADAIATLLERANDWVPEVRAAAIAAVDAHLRPEFVDGWAASLVELEGLRRAERSDPAPLLARIDAFLADPERLSRIESATAGAATRVRRTVRALRIGAARDDAERARLHVVDAAAGDVVLALEALRAARSLRDPGPRAAVRAAAAQSPHPAVRRAALLDALADAEASAAIESLSRFAFDASASVRSVALRAAGPTRKASLARAALDRLADDSADGAAATGDRQRAIALAVVVEIDAAEAAGAAEAHLDAVGTRLRETAYAAVWRRADAPRRETLALAALADPAARLQAWAARAVARDGLVPSWSDLLATASASPSPTRTSAVARVLTHGSPWPRLVVLLTLLDRDAGVVAAHLDRWVEDTRTGFVAPSPTEWACVESLWMRVASRLPAVGAARVAALLARWQPDLR